MLSTICMYGDAYSKSMDQPGKVANPVRDQLIRDRIFPYRSAFASENLVLRDGFGSPPRGSVLISVLRLNLVLTCGIPPEFRGGIHLCI